MEVIPLCPDGEIGIHAVFKPQFFGVRVRLPLGTLNIYVMKTLTLILSLLVCLFTYSQTYLVNQHFSNVAPTGWSSTSNVWSFTYNGSSTSNYRNVFDATTYSARFSSAANGNSIYLYIPINFISGKNYTITFFTKRVCSVTINTNELPNQTTLLSTETQTNPSCNSNWNTWYQWSTTLLSNYTGAGYFQIWTKTIYGGPTSAYLDDVSIYETDPIGLPIELLEFKGKAGERENTLNWVSATESNNDYYTIYYMNNENLNWKDVIHIAGAGTSSIVHNYQVTIPYAYQGINYYMLEQTDTDGKHKTYNDLIVSIDNTSKTTKLISRITNSLGQDIDDSYKGIIFIIFSDGSTIIQYRE